MSKHRDDRPTDAHAVVRRFVALDEDRSSGARALDSLRSVYDGQTALDVTLAPGPTVERAVLPVSGQQVGLLVLLVVLGVVAWAVWKTPQTGEVNSPNPQTHPTSKSVSKTPAGRVDPAAPPPGQDQLKPVVTILDTVPSGAEVTIDGSVVGQTPLPVVLLPGMGAKTVSVYKKAYNGAVARIDGSQPEMIIRLEPASSRGAQPTPPAEAGMESGDAGAPKDARRVRTW
jgi:hypothetical protein